jgi:hypothetical protein
MHDQEAIEGLREVIARIEEEKRELEEENEFYRSIKVTPCADRGEHVLEACCCLPHLPLLLKREQEEAEAFFFRNRLHQRPWEKKNFLLM